MIKKTKRISITFLLIGILLFVISACATIGRDFPIDAVYQIHIGETTQTDIKQILGSPWRTGLENGMKTWTYGYYSYNPFSKTITKDLVIRFDKNGIVISYSFNTSDGEAND